MVEMQMSQIMKKPMMDCSRRIRGTLAAVLALMFQDTSVAVVVGRKNDENTGRRDASAGIALN